MATSCFADIEQLCHMKKLDLRAKSYLTALVLISSTNCCMPVHAHTPHGMLQSGLFPQRSIFRSVQHTHFLCFFWTPSLACTLYLSLLAPIRTLDLVHTHVHVGAHKHPPFLYLHSHTHTGCSGGLQMCVLICFQHRLFSCQCADSEFSTLSYEIRVGDIRPIQ